MFGSDTSGASRGALTVFVVMAFFYLGLQYQNYALYFLGHRSDAVTVVRDLSFILFGQAQNLGVAALFAVLFAVVAQRAVGRWLFFVLFCSALIYLVLDNIFYTFFFDHYYPGMIESKGQSMRALWGSLRGEIGGAFAVDAIAALACMATVGRLVLPPPKPGRLSSPWARRNWQVIAFNATIYAVMAAVTASRGDFQNLTAHPMVTLASGMFRMASQTQAVPGDTTVDPIDIYPLRFGRPAGLGRVPATWRDRPASHQGTRPPNVVLFVLESVGSMQLLPDGRLDADVTPFLASLAPEMTIFPNVYDSFPATAEAHVLLATGGYTVSSGSAFREFKYPYLGPTLPGEMQAAGYRTGLFSAQYMDTENLGTVYANLPWDERLTPETGTNDFRNSNQLNSWGLDERALMRGALSWIDRQSAPFYLEFMTSATHHPYAVPADFAPRAVANAGDDRTNRHARYAEALRFTDAVIRQLFEHLKANGRLGDTVVFLCGDHGEAFGNWHRQNFGHFNRLYDENVRNDLVVIDSRKHDGPTLVPTIASVGDIAPTIAGYARSKAPVFLGQNLFDPGYQSRIVYFNKHAEPQQWGLRDGKWKFIARRLGDPSPELYDLERDEHEQNNLAAAHPEQIAVYERLVKNWYLRANREFVARLRGYPKSESDFLTVENVSIPGPKHLGFGVLTDDDFLEQAVINPAEIMSGFATGAPFLEATVVDAEWTSPAGAKQVVHFLVRPNQMAFPVPHESDTALEEGHWRVQLSSRGTSLITSEFVVSRSAPLISRRPSAFVH